MEEEHTQRKLAAILAADVVGYSRLMETDEAGTLARLKILQDQKFAAGEYDTGFITSLLE